MQRALFISGIACLMAVVLTAAPALPPNPQPSYTPIVEAYDWGPGISRLVIDLGRPVLAASLNQANFKLTVGRYKAGTNSVLRVRDWSTMTDHSSQGSRQVLAVYASDERGNKTPQSTSQYITLDLKIGPELDLASPFNFDFSLFLNQWVDVRHTLAISQGLIAADGTPIGPLELGPEAAKAMRLPLSEEFDCTGISTCNDPQFGPISLRYAAWSPRADGQKHPLIIWLHGAGEGGTDPRIALLGNRVTTLIRDPVQRLMGGAFVLVPQTPLVWMHNGKQAYPMDGSTQYTKALKQLMDEFVTARPDIDRSRLYIGGCSNGGFMTMEMILRYPQTFAAAWPVCEAYADRWISDRQIESIIKLPIWFTQAKSDATVKAAEGGYVVQTYQRLVAAGAANVHCSYFDRVVDKTGLWVKPDGSPYEYNGHWSWIYALNNQCELDFDGQPVKLRGKATTLFEWMAAQRR